MKKIILILLLFLALPVYAENISYDKDTCLKESGYVASDTKFDANTTYADSTNKLYGNLVQKPDGSPYSQISCREFMGISTTGNVKDMVAGAGFEYEVKVTTTVVCKFTFDYVNFNTAYNKATKQDVKTAMDGELALYNEWFNGLSGKYNSEIIVSAMMETVDENDTDETTMVNTGMEPSSEPKVYQIEKIGDKNLASYSKKAKVGGNETFVYGYKAYTIVKTYIPVAKKMIISGPNYGKIILGTDKSSYRCANPENKIFTDYNMTNGNYSLKFTVENINKGWTIESNCGYNIYNKGSISKETRLSFRQISLADPFPNDSVGINWSGYEDLITGEEFDSEPIYVVELDKKSINAIKQYNDANYKSNKDNGYIVFIDMNSNTSEDNTKLDKYKSQFIYSKEEGFANIFTKKPGDN